MTHRRLRSPDSADPQRHADPVRGARRKGATFGSAGVSLYHGGFEFLTKPPLLRAKVFMRAGRANVIVHHENYGSDGTLERYVMAEDPIEFIEPDVNLEIEAFLYNQARA